MVVVDSPSHNAVITAKVTADQRHAAEKAARDLGVTMSHLTRLALAHFLDLKPDAARRYASAVGQGEAYA